MSMTAEEKILQYLERLPPPLYAEVLDFIEYLLASCSISVSANRLGSREAATCIVIGSTSG
jgi:hypothetical protein